MKKLYFFVLLAAILVACQPKTEPVDLVASKAEVNSLMEKYLTAWNAKDTITLSTLLTQDGLFCGTDPAELMDKKMVTDAWKQFFADPAFNNTYVVDKRVIRVVADGNTALVMEQHSSNPFTPKIPWRLVLLTIKTDSGWKIDYLSWNLIPKNEDYQKLNMALE